MASAQASLGWLRGKVKVAPSGDCLVIMAITKAEIPPEKTITLSSLVAPRLARRGGVDEPFAWDSREFLRKICIGKEVTFKVYYTIPSIGREFGSVFIGDKNVALMVVAAGWAKAVRDAITFRVDGYDPDVRASVRKAATSYFALVVNTFYVKFIILQ